MALTKEQLIEEIKGMSVLDLSELVKAIETEFGVSAAAPVAVAAGPGAAGAAQEGAAETQQTEFKVTIKEIGDNKISLIKMVKELKNNAIGLKESKELVDKAPAAVILENVPEAEANEAKTKLEGLGATVEIS